VATLEAQGRLAYDWDDDADPAAVLNKMGIELLVSIVVSDRRCGAWVGAFYEAGA